MDYYRDTRAEIKHKTHPTIFPYLKINFNVFTKTRFRNYRRDPHSGTGPELIHGLKNSDFDTFASDSITFLKELSYDGVREAAEGVVSGTPLLSGERQRVIERACEEVRKRCGETLPKYTILDLDFTIKIEHLHVYSICKVGCAGTTEAGLCCCICLEDLSGGEVAARMPCKHVYHGGCIKEWLRMSHCCPLCRHEMPREQIIYFFWIDT